MSIIYDALKKVEQSGKPLVKNEAEKEITAPKKRIKKYLIYILFLMLGLFFANLTLTYLIPNLPMLTKIKIVNMAKNAPAPDKPPIQTALKPTPPPPVITQKPETETKPTFALNGIFFSGPDSYALVNNQIVKVGNKISGAVIKEISANEVLLNFENTEIRLTTAH